MNNKWLVAGALGSGIAALAHLGCIVFGGDWYRALGAGEQMARLAEAGDPAPTIMTAAIAGVLSLWTLCALSGAGVIFRLPLLRTALLMISGIYLGRALAFPLIMPMFPDNSLLFWLISSGICLALGSCYAFGLRQAWPVLSR